MFAIIKFVLLQVSYLLPTICNILPLVHLSVIIKLFYSPTSIQGPSQILLLVWSLTEIIFLIYMTLLINSLNSTPPQRKYFTTAEHGRVLIKQVLAQTKGGLLELMHIWRNLCEPRKQNAGEIGVRNAKNWISWAIYDVTDYNQLSLDEKQVIDEEFLNSEEYKALNLPDISEIESPEWNFHDRNALKLSRVPFFLYFFSWLAKLVAASWFKLNGFTNYTKKDVGGLSYWFRPGDLEKTPIVFVHGVGIGLLQYITKIRQLKQLHSDRPIIILQLDYISMSLIHKIPTTAEHVTLIDHIFTHHTLKPANWISHSYGSFVGAFITHKRPHLINNITFVDPICFGLIFCNSLYNLLYTPVKCWTLGFIRYFGAFELSFNYIIHREFIWKDRIFWPDYCNLIDGKVTVYLSEFDSIIDEKEVGNYVRRYFEHKNFEMKTIKGEYHGGYLFNSVKLNQVLEEL